MKFPGDFTPLALELLDLQQPVHQRCVDTQEIGKVPPVCASGNPSVQHGAQCDLHPNRSPAFSCPARVPDSNLLSVSCRLLSSCQPWRGAGTSQEPQLSLHLSLLLNCAIRGPTPATEFPAWKYCAAKFIQHI